GDMMRTCDSIPLLQSVCWAKAPVKKNMIIM
ncbi:uncharacterized protein METZ01_LOCUS490328, partial [marine metagenome]